MVRCLQMQNLIYGPYQKIKTLSVRECCGCCLFFTEQKLLDEFHEKNVHLIPMFLQYHSLYHVAC